MRLRTNALQTVQQRSVGLFPQQTAPARKSDEYWQPKAKISRRERNSRKTETKTGKTRQNFAGNYGNEDSNPTGNPASAKRRKRTNRRRRSSAPQTKKKKPKGLLKRIEKISRKKDEYLSLRNELIEKRKQYLALRAAKKSAIKTISQFEDEQKFENSSNTRCVHREAKDEPAF